MTKILALLLLSSTNARAGWWSNFCERHLIAADPYQFEQTSDYLLIRERYRYSLKASNGIATKRDRELFILIDNELKSRGHQ